MIFYLEEYDKYVKEFAAALEKQGQEVQLITDCSKYFLLGKEEPREDSVFYGTISGAKYFNCVYASKWDDPRVFDRYKPTFLSAENGYFRFSHLAARVGHMLLNGEYALLPIGDFSRVLAQYPTYGEHVFIRPDEGDKSIPSGTFDIYSSDDQMGYLKRIQDDSHRLGYADKLVVIAPYQSEIKKEFRLFFKGKEFVTGSQYMDDYSAEIEPIKEEDNRLLKDWIYHNLPQLGDAGLLPDNQLSVLDVAIVGRHKLVRIVEMNCFNTSNTYDCDLDKLAKAAVETFQTNYNEYQERKRKQIRDDEI